MRPGANTDAWQALSYVSSSEPHEKLNRDCLLPSAFGPDIETVQRQSGTVVRRQLKPKSVSCLLEAFGGPWRYLALEVEDRLDEFPAQSGPKGSAPQAEHGIAHRQVRMPNDDAVKLEDDMHGMPGVARQVTSEKASIASGGASVGSCRPECTLCPGVVMGQ